MVVDTQNEHIDSILKKHNFRKVRDNEWHYVGTVYTKMQLQYKNLEFYHVDFCSNLKINIGDHIIIETNGTKSFVTDSLEDLDSYLDKTLYIAPPLSKTECVV